MSESFGAGSLALKKARSLEEIRRALLRYFENFFWNVAYLVIRQDEIVGLDARGTRLTADLVKQVAIPVSSPSIFRRVMADRMPYCGSLGDNEADSRLVKWLGYHPDTIFLAPIRVSGKTAALVYADGAQSPLGAQELSALLSEAERAHERVLARSA